MNYSFITDFTFYRKIKRNIFQINERIIDKMKSDGLKGYIRDLLKFQYILFTFHYFICIIYTIIYKNIKNIPKHHSILCNN